MAEKSLFWFTDGFTGSVGDGTTPYTQEEFREYNQKWAVSDVATQGPLSGIDNELEVTGTATPLSMDTGRAFVDGFPYFSDSSVSLAVTVPAVGDTGGRVILRADFVAQTVRAFVLLSADGTATIPTLTQSAGVTWEISLASFVIEIGGNIFTDAGKATAGVTDTRAFCISPLAGMVKLREFVGDGTSGTATFADIQQDLTHLMIVGYGRSDNASVNTVVDISFNGIGGSNYEYVRLNGVNSTTNSFRVTLSPHIEISRITAGNGTANAFDSFRAEIPNYSDSTGFVAVQASGEAFSDGATANMSVNITSGWLTNATNVTDVAVSLGSGNWVTGTRITLYGRR